MLATVLVLLLVYLFYRWWTRNYEHWKKLGVPHVRGIFPFGSMAGSILMRRTIGEDLEQIYKQFPSEPAVGFFKLCQPVLMLRDPQLIKTVLVKDFSRFHDNDYYVNRKRDPIMGLNPFFVPGPSWKILRSIITSPVTLSKLKRMVPEMVDACKSMVTYFKQLNGRPIEVRQAVGYYAMDSSAKCAFGLDWDSFFNETVGFRRVNTDQLFATGFWANLACLTTALNLTTLADLLKLRISTKNVEDFFVSMVKEVTKYRSENNIKKQDYMQQLIDSEIGVDYKNCPEYTYTEVAAHCMTFFLDSFETSGIVFAYVMYELAVNPEIQERLIKEIDGIDVPLEKMDYQVLHSMNLLDMVLSETMRLHPPLQTITRLCSYETSLVTSRGRIRLEEGTPVAIPVSALHMDPQHFQRPEKFIPERFSDTDDSGLISFDKFAYLPFGEGPRKCTGFQFVSTQIKMGVVALLKEFMVQPRDNTKVVLDPKNCFMHTPKNGIWLKFIARE